MALQPLYKGLGKAEFEGGEVKKNKNHCSLTLPSSPSPLPLPQREGSDMRDTPCGSQIFPLIITQANCFLHSPLCRRGAGGEAVPQKRENQINTLVLKDINFTINIIELSYYRTIEILNQS